MGDVIHLPGRPGSTSRGDDVPPVAAAEGESATTVTPAGDTRPPAAPVAETAARDLWPTALHLAHRAGKRFVFEVSRGAPRRVWRLLRWFVRGVIGRRDSSGEWVGGWIGLVLWILAVRERRDAHKAAADNPGIELRATTQADRIAWWHFGVVVVPHLALLVVLNRYLPGWEWLTAAPAVIITIIYGHHIDPRPPAPVTASRERANITIETINGALRAVGILKESTNTRPDPDGVTLARMPRWVGGGQEVVFDLPASVRAEAADVVKQRGRLAASLSTPLAQLVVEPGAHAGQVVMWQAGQDPFAGESAEHPLLEESAWSVFQPVPIGTDARGRGVAVPLVDTHFLIGAVPGAGKTMAARALTAGAVLDPSCEVYVFDGKHGRDWTALRPLATQYESGPMREQARTLTMFLEQCIDEGDRRFDEMQRMTDEECPENAITPHLTANGMPFRWLVIDEAHRHLGDEVYGQRITDLLIEYVKGYRACGFGLLLCTQDAEGGVAQRFTALRRVIGSRFALRVMDWQASNMILGDEMNTRGWNAAEIQPSQRGTGIFRAALELAGGDANDGVLARMLRTYYLDSRAWRHVCEHGVKLREVAAAAAQDATDTAPVDVVPDEHLTASEVVDRFRRSGAAHLVPAHVRGAQAMGEWLSSLGVRTEDRKVRGNRVRSRAAVERALNLPNGSLHENQIGGQDPADEPTGDREPTGVTS